jgi:transposase
MRSFTLQNYATMFRKGMSFHDIASKMGCSVKVVRSVVSPVFPNAVKRRQAVTIKEIATMERMRFRGYTLQEIANMMDRGTSIVYRYTEHICNARRLNRCAVVNTRHGYVDGYAA